MRAYYEQADIKEKLLAQLEEDFQEGRIVQGEYWNGECGCLIGCATRDKSHALYEEMYGVPRALARVFDRVFEGLPFEDARRFSLDVHQAIPVGADLSFVLPQFMLWLLDDEEDDVKRFASDRGKSAIETVVSLYRRKIAGESVTEREWQSAYAAAADAYAYAAAAADAYAAAAAASAADAYAAAAAAYAAAYAYAAAAADAYADAAAAYAAAYAADAAADAYADAAAAKQKHYERMRDKLLSLLQEAAV